MIDDGWQWTGFIEKFKHIQYEKKFRVLFIIFFI